MGSNQASGIMALGSGVESLVSQTASTYGNAFSYCMPPSGNYLGFFTAESTSPREFSSMFVLTPMMVTNDTFHRVLLRTIIVAGQRLDVATEVFAAGTVLDSCTTITRLPLTAYDALRSAFRSNMLATYPAAPPKGNLDTCFDFTGFPALNLPRIELVFDQDAVLELDPSGVLFSDCLSFAANSDDTSPGILGSVQQQAIEVLYDLGGGSVGFRRLAC